jgi:hypothetical protein
MILQCRRGPVKVEIDQLWWIGETVLSVVSFDETTGEICFESKGTYKESYDPAYRVPKFYEDNQHDSLQGVLHFRKAKGTQGDLYSINKEWSIAVAFYPVRA